MLKIVKIIAAVSLAISFLFLHPPEANAQTKNYIFVPNDSNFFVLGIENRQFIINQSKLTEWGLQKDFSGLSTGKRIVTAGDDPAGLAVAEKMNALIASLRQQSMNAEDLRNYTNYIEASLGQDQQILLRIRELILRSSNGILGPDDREYIQEEIDQLIKEIDMNSQISQFNKKRVIEEVTSESLGLVKVDVVKSPDASIGVLDEAMKKIQRLRTVAGAKNNILTFQIEGKSYYMLNLQSAESGIRDIDMAEGTISLMKNSVLLKAQYGIILLMK